MYEHKLCDLYVDNTALVCTGISAQQHDLLNNQSIWLMPMLAELASAPLQQQVLCNQPSCRACTQTVEPVAFLVEILTVMPTTLYSMQTRRRAIDLPE